jgi:hypothetical protein
MTSVPPRRIVRGMDRTAAIAELPVAYATALRPRDEGLTKEASASRLDTEVQAVEPLLASLPPTSAASSRPQNGSPR